MPRFCYSQSYDCDLVDLEMEMSDLESKQFQNSARKLVLKTNRQVFIENSLILILISSAQILV